MKNGTDRHRFRRIRKQGGSDEKGETEFRLSGTVEGKLGIKESASKQAPEKKFTAPVKGDADT